MLTFTENWQMKIKKQFEETYTWICNSYLIRHRALPSLYGGSLEIKVMRVLNSFFVILNLSKSF